MKQLDFTYLAAENFLCFGSEGIEINLLKHDNIILVLGNNLDNLDTDEEGVSSNGSGKSSLAEILVYTLYGRTIREPKKLRHEDLINNKTGKKLRTEVRWGDYRVVRTRKPNSLRLWESKDHVWDNSTEISLGGIPATQKLLEEKLGLTYRAFVNVVIFTDNKLGCFLECDKAAKREIVENLFSVDKCRIFADTAKGTRNEFKSQIKTITIEYDGLLSQLNVCRTREKEILEQENQWVANKEQEIQDLTDELEEVKEKLESSAEGELISVYQQAQERIKDITEVLPDLEGKKSTLQEAYDLAKSKLDQSKQNKHKLTLEKQEAASAIKKTELEISTRRGKIEAVESQKGTRCDKCYAIVSEKNYGLFIQQTKNEIDHFSGELGKNNKLYTELSGKITKLQSGINQIEQALKLATSKLNQITEKIAAYHTELTKLKEVEKPEIDLHHAVLKEQIDSLTDRIKVRQKELSGESPYAKIMKSAKEETERRQDECDKKKLDLEAAEKELPYYEFWVTAFGDAGIRKFVIDSIVPALNAKVAHWLSILIDGKVKLVFDSELDETIERNPADGDPYVYPQMSGGEKQRLNLSVSQGFAHVLMLSSGASPSLIFLDEVASNIDRIGVVGIYNMILELSKTRQVFITTHDRDLLEMLNGCEKLKLERKNGFTKILS